MKRKLLRIIKLDFDATDQLVNIRALFKQKVSRLTTVHEVDKA